MTLAEVTEFFEKKVRYKPGWRFSVYNELHIPEISIRVQTSPVPCADEYALPEGHKREPWSLTQISRYSLDFLQDEKQLAWIAQTLIKKMELHEVDEWLRVDDRHVNNPHPERKVAA